MCYCNVPVNATLSMGANSKSCYNAIIRIVAISLLIIRTDLEQELFAQPIELSQYAVKILWIVDIKVLVCLSASYGSSAFSFLQIKITYLSHSYTSLDVGRVHF